MASITYLKKVFLSDIGVEPLFQVLDHARGVTGGMPRRRRGFTPGPPAVSPGGSTWRWIRNAARAVIILALCLTGLSIPSRCNGQDRIHEVFFENTDYELNVYHIKGKLPGNTLMLIGGIQGDEPGGFLSVDHYADISLARGNLIVVPRANFQSIILNRRKVNEDMNRKFDESNIDNYETKVVSILKELIAQSDCLLNLHDGSGFYSDKWVDAERNPYRFGQSIIADADVYTRPQTGHSVHLGDMARGVCERINARIKDPAHHFHFNNHRTGDADSIHKEQRKSATYYALTQCGIPAFGIETSKSLPLSAKVFQHNLAVNAFMDLLDVEVDSPGLHLDPPKLKYLVVAVNHHPPMVVENRQTVTVHPDDQIRISHIEANYERGLTADIIGYGTINDMRKPIRVSSDTRIVVRKDYTPMGTVFVKTDTRSVPHGDGIDPSLPERLSDLFFRLRCNDRVVHVPNYGHLKLVKGDLFEIEQVLTRMADPDSLVVNLKGFVGQKGANTGEDRGYQVDTGRSLWPRYSLHRKGLHYQVVVTLDEREVGKMFVDLEVPALKYVVVSQGNGGYQCVFPGGELPVVKLDAVRLVDINTNISGGVGVTATVAYPGIAPLPVPINAPLPLHTGGETLPADTARLDIHRGSMLLGSVYFKKDGKQP